MWAIPFTFIHWQRDREMAGNLAKDLVGTGSEVPRLPTVGAAQMGKVNDENVKTGQQETNEPWKKPDHSDHHPDKDSPSPRPRRAEDNKTS
jgi:hypothetical protein